MSKEKANIGGIFTFQQVRDGEVIDQWDEHNIVVDEGLNYIMDTSLNTLATTPKASNFYIGIFKNNYTPVYSDVYYGANSFISPSVSGEVISGTDVSETTRPEWVLPASSVGGHNLVNSASLAQYTFTSITPVTIYGAFLTNDNDMSYNSASPSSILIAAAKFGTSRTMQQNDVLQISYGISASGS